MASLYSLSTIAGPLLMTQALAHYTEQGARTYFPGAAFVLAGLLALFCLIFFVSEPAARRRRPSAERFLTPAPCTGRRSATGPPRWNARMVP